MTSRANAPKMSSYDRRMRRRALLKHSRHCHWCGKKLSNRTATLDHLLPRAHGGGDHLANLVLACKPCNLRRGTKEIDAWVDELARTG